MKKTENKYVTDINRKISKAEESYKKISFAWLSTKEIGTRIDSLLALARELRSIENQQ